MKLSQILNSTERKLTKGLLSAFLVSSRRSLSKHTLLFYHRCLSKATGMYLTHKTDFSKNYVMVEIQFGNSPLSSKAFANFS
jgi:hypothetical protein